MASLANGAALLLYILGRVPMPALLAFGCLFARAGRVSMRRGILTGMGWGLFLETFQLALYPGWLNIKFLDEFRQISFLSHLVFGATLGILVPAGLRWQDRRVEIGGLGEP